MLPENISQDILNDILDNPPSTPEKLYVALMTLRNNTNNPLMIAAIDRYINSVENNLVIF